MPGKRRVPALPPLAGLRVLDASRILAGPTLAQTLGDLGADVIKVEDPRGGDPTRAWGPPFVAGIDRVSAYFVAANRNKRSITVDLKSAAGRGVFRQLIVSSDVLVDNFLPRRWREFGISAAEIRRSNPRLVRVVVSGYGSRGARADQPAFDLVLQGESGLMSVTGFPDREPVRVGVAIIDILTALHGVTATLAALLERQRTGRGRRVDVSMIDAGTAFLSYAAQSWLADGRQPAALGSRHPNLVPYQAFPARDGWILIGVGSDAMFARLCLAIGRPRWATEARFRDNESRLAHREELERELTGLLRRRGRAHWQALLAQHGVAAGPVRSVEEAIHDARGRGQVVALPGGAFGKRGALETVSAPWLFDGKRPRPRRSPPALGEHTEEVLAELRDRQPGGRRRR